MEKIKKYRAWYLIEEYESVDLEASSRKEAMKKAGELEDSMCGTLVDLEKIDA